MSRITGAVPSFARSTRAALARSLIVVSLAAATGCLDDSPVAPASGTVQVAIRAQVAPGPGERAVAIDVYYYRQNEERIALPATPAQVSVPRGGTSTQQVTIDISSCVADPERARGESGAGCLFFIELRLLDQDGEFISGETQEVEASAPGEQVEVQPFNLPQASVGVSPTAIEFEATEHDELFPEPQSVVTFSSTGAELGELSVEVIYPGDGEILEWLHVTLEGDIPTLQPRVTNLSPDTYTATVRVSGSRGGVAPGDVSVTYTVHGRPRRLVVSGDGGGAATVVSSPEGIQCVLAFGRTNAGCIEEFPFGTVVTLSITPAEGSIFEGWSGACSGAGDCIVRMDEDLEAVANFAPSGGGDFVMLGDANILDARALENPDNQRLVANLVSYGTLGARRTATRVLIDCRATAATYICPLGFDSFESALEAVGFSATITSSIRGELTSIPADVKLLVFIAPCEWFTASELVALRNFAKEGGRIVLVSEYQSFYGVGWQLCSSAQNQLASGLGTSVQLAGGDWHSGYNTLPPEALRPHQITEGMTSLTFGYSSRIAADTSARALFYNMTNEVLLGAVARIDTGPLPVEFSAPLAASLLRSEDRMPLLPRFDLSGTGR